MILFSLFFIRLCFTNGQQQANKISIKNFFYIFGYLGASISWYLLQKEHIDAAAAATITIVQGHKIYKTRREREMIYWEDTQLNTLWKRFIVCYHDDLLWTVVDAYTTSYRVRLNQLKSQPVSESVTFVGPFSPDQQPYDVIGGGGTYVQNQ